MKNTLAILATILTCSITQANGARPVSFNDLAKDITNIGQVQGDGGPAGKCSLKVAGGSGYLVVTLASQNGGVVRVQARSQSQILLVGQKQSPDGSFQRKYRVDGTQTVSITHADDAFIIVSLSNGASTINCEMDF